MFDIFKTAPEPTLEQRLSSAVLLSANARAAFVAAAVELETVADTLDILAQDTQNQLDRLVDILEAAIEDSDANRAAARNLRALVEPSQPYLF